MFALLGDSNVVGDGVMDAEYSLFSKNNQMIMALLMGVEPTEFIQTFVIKLTLIVFLKFLGSSGSSNGYAPTSITYSVTPHDQTSAIYKEQ